MSEELIAGALPPMSEQERLQKCNEELMNVLERYGCELQSVPHSRAEGSILIIDALPRLVIRQR